MLIKKLINIFFTFIFLFFGFSALTQVQAQEAPIYLFYGNGCSHCVQVENYFEEQDLYSKYSIEKKEVYFDRDNAVLFNTLLEKLEVPENQRGVPLVIIGDKVIVGDKPIIDNFIIEADKYFANNFAKTQLLEPELASEIALKTTDSEPVETKPIGKDLTLFAVIAASLVDAINPCAFAVLIILMTTILAVGDGKKALKSGFAFAASIFISYFLMGLGLYKALGVGNLSNLFFKIVGWLAIFLGLFNLKDWLWYGKGFLMEVPMSWRPKLKSLLHSVTSPVGAFGIGFLISLFLLPCTSGPYIVILGMLANTTLQAKAIFYLVIYNLIFVTPMMLITLAVYKGYDPAKAEKIRQKQLKNLHLIAGIIMLVMGIVILKGWI